MTDTQAKELDRIRRKSKDGKLHWQDVVKVAKDPKSCLHREFTWDLKRAAEELWAEQARDLIQSYTIRVMESHPQRIRAYVQVSPSGGYTPMSEARKNPDQLRSLAYREIGNCLSSLYRINADGVVSDLIAKIGALLPGEQGVRDAG